MIPHKCFHGLVFGKAEAVVALRGFAVSILGADPELAGIVAREHGPVLLRLVFKDGVPLTQHLLRRKRYSHFYFVGFKFFPGAAVHPHPAVLHPGFGFAQLTQGRDHNVEAYQVRAMRVGNTQSNMSIPAATALRMSLGCPTPIR